MVAMVFLKKLNNIFHSGYTIYFRLTKLKTFYVVRYLIVCKLADLWKSSQNLYCQAQFQLAIALAIELS